MRGTWQFALVLAGLFFSPMACAFSAAAEDESDLDWDPETTRVFIVGLLEWERADIWNSFPDCKPNRRDQQLADYFREAGVPADQFVYLQDAEATKRHIQKEFVKFLEDSEEGELLVFYFCGHGFRDRKTDETWFANYDAGDENDSAWSVLSIYAAIEKHFSGNRALLLADCCHSGALYDLAQKHRDSDIAYAVLTSSYSHNSSTGNWTFSDSVLAGLNGEAAVDLNGDEVVDLSEIATYTELELAFIEGQKSMFSADSRFGRKVVLADVEDSVEARVGQRVEVDFDGKWYKAKTVDTDGPQLEVHYVNFPDSADEWVTPERIRPYQPAQFAAGDKVTVRWDTDGKWYPATVIRGWYGLHFVHYDDDSSLNDEWVGPGAIQLRSE